MGILDFIRERRANLDELAQKRQKERTARGRIRIKSHLSEVLDPRSAVPLFEDIKAVNPLDFAGYAEKTASLASRSGLADAFICAEGRIAGYRVVCAELIPEFLMGSMGTAVGEAVCRSAEYALEHKLPLIIFSASGGARMQEGMFSLMQMAKTSQAIRRLSDAGGLFISVLTHPTTGGVTASFASLGDIIVAEPGALIGFAGPRVIEQTIRSTLPEGFQSAEFQQAHGFVDAIVERSELRATLTRLLSLHPTSCQSSLSNQDTQSNRKTQSGQADRSTQGTLSAQNTQGADRAPLPNVLLVQTAASDTPDASDAADLAPHAEALIGSLALAGAPSAKTPKEHVDIARHLSRPHAYDFIATLFDEFIELRGDRLFRDDHALIGGLARFEGTPLTVAAHLKGSDLTENITCNFGMPHPEGYRKFIRLAKAAEKFGRPLVTFIDTPGAYPGAEAEERGQGEAIAQCLFTLSALAVPTIAIITGEGGSGGALALGLADCVFMYEYAIYSVLSPEGFASILWKDSKRATEASEVMKLTAQDLLGFGMIDGIIREPEGGAHLDPAAATEALRPLLRAALTELRRKDSKALTAERYEKYRKFR